MRESEKSVKSGKTFDEKVNSITKDSIVLFCVLFPAGILYGIGSENGDVNAGSMYGLLVLPFWIFTVFCLAIVEFSKAAFPKMKVGVVLIPLIFCFGAYFMKSINGIFLVTSIAITVLYSFLKFLRQIKALRNDIRHRLCFLLSDFLTSRLFVIFAAFRCKK